VYDPLRELIEMTVGVEAELRSMLSAFDGIEAAVIHGSWAEDRLGARDVDVLVIGDVDYNLLRSEIRRLEQRIGRRVDLMAYRPEEFAAMVRDRNGFVEAVLTGPTKPLVGDIKELGSDGAR
jgi:predicted nucleotidyltransferase